MKILMVLPTLLTIFTIYALAGMHSGIREIHREHFELIEDLTEVVQHMEERITTLEDRPEIMIQSANVFNTEDDIVIKSE